MAVAAVSWGETRERLHSRFNENANDGLVDWLHEYARAFIAADAEQCARLVGEPFAYPETLAPLIRDRLGSAARALGSNPAEATDLLTRASGQTSGIARRLALAVVTGERGDEVWKQVAAHGLEGFLLETVGNTDAAASAYFEAGKHSGEGGNSDDDTSPIQLLERACELDPQHPLAHWYLADAWRLRSSSAEPPYVLREPLERSLAAWNKGAAAHLPDADTSWAYLLRAFLAELRARFHENKPVLCWWEAILYLERAILLNETDAGRWAALGRCYRLLGHDQASLHATAKAIEQSSDDLGALEERAASLAETGAFSDARSTIERRITQGEGLDSTWALGLKAYILAHQREYRAAIELIDRTIATEPTNVWNLNLKATCLWMLGDQAGARELYGRVLGAGAPSSDEVARAFAAYRLGRTDEAIEMFEALASDPLSGEDVSRLLGLCRLVKGEVSEAEDLLQKGMTNATARELDDFLAWDLAGVDLGGERASRSERTALLSRVTTIAAALAERARGSLTGTALATHQELMDAWQSDPALVAQDPVSVAAVRASLARLQMEAGRWSDAAASYAELCRAPGLCPEAEKGIERILEGIPAISEKPADDQISAATDRFDAVVKSAADCVQESRLVQAQKRLGEILWRAGRGAEALEHFRAALARTNTGDGRALAEAHARLGLALELQDLSQDARDHHVTAARLDGAAVTEPGEGLTRVCRPLIRSVTDFWKIQDAWRALAGDAALQGELGAVFEGAAASLATYLDDYCGLAEPLSAEKSKPWVIPVTLEVGSAIVPLVDPASSQSGNGKFLNVDIPEMRKRISASLGTPDLPGVLVRAAPSTTEGYAILLDDAPAATGSVRVGAKFVGDLSEAPGADASSQAQFEMKDPSTGLMGRWYPGA